MDAKNAPRNAKKMLKSQTNQKIAEDKSYYTRLKVRNKIPFTNVKKSPRNRLKNAINSKSAAEDKIYLAKIF